MKYPSGVGNDFLPPTCRFFPMAQRLNGCCAVSYCPNRSSSIAST